MIPVMVPPAETFTVIFYDQCGGGRFTLPGGGGIFQGNGGLKMNFGRMPEGSTDIFFSSARSAQSAGNKCPQIPRITQIVDCSNNYQAMHYTQILPDPKLESMIECYWIAESDDPKIRRLKIVPDGFPEIIFHYADPYRIKLGKEWATQSKSLLAGQTSNHFF